MIRVAIIGASGYTASESIRILLGHPQVQITYLTASKEHGHLYDMFPMFRGRLDLDIEAVDLAKLAEKADIALCCLPHMVAMTMVPQLLDAGVKVVDFSADYRIHDAQQYEQTYQIEHSDKENLARAAFGLPELFRSQIAGAKLVANPGCYPTAASLALAPLVKGKLIALDDIIINAVSGVSGAGRKPTQAFHFPEMDGNLFAYGVGNHRHGPEIEQILTDVAGKTVKVLFQPHVVCIERGISESIYCQPLSRISENDLRDLYQSFYKKEPFVRVLSAPPTLRNVTYTNFCDIFPTMAKGRIVVFSMIDNLIKGAAGQAIQNMNLLCNLPETMGQL